MKRALFFALICLFALPANADTAADQRDCANNNFDAEPRIAACTRLLESGGLSTTEQARVLLERGDAKEDLEQWDKVFEDYYAARDLDPENPRAHREIGWAFLQQKDCAGAVAPLDRAIELDPRSAWAFHMRGLAHGRLKNYDQALADYNKALELNPRGDNTLQARGFLRVKREEHTEAVADFDQVLALRPYRAGTYSARASAHEQLGATADAIRDAGVALLLNPNLGLPGRIQERLHGPSGDADPGSAEFAEPDNGSVITYLQVVTDATEELHEMEAAIMDLVNFFRAEVLPLPESKRFITRTIGATDADITTVNALLTHSSDGNNRDVTYYRALWPTVFPMGSGGPTLDMAYDKEALAGVWPLEVGRETQGGGALNLVCPDEPTPMSAMLQCEPGGLIPMGKLGWSVKVERFEDVAVPAGIFGAYVVTYVEKTELQMFGQTMAREVATTFWYSPEHRWWLKRESEFQGKVNISVAVSIE